MYIVIIDKKNLLDFYDRYKAFEELEDAVEYAKEYGLTESFMKADPEFGSAYMEMGSSDDRIIILNTIINKSKDTESPENEWVNKISNNLKPFGFALDNLQLDNKEDDMNWARYTSDITEDDCLIIYKSEVDIWERKVKAFLINTGKEKVKDGVRLLLGLTS